MDPEGDVDFNIPGTLSKHMPRTADMGRVLVDFAPIRIDRGIDYHVVAGTQGELLILDSEGIPRGKSATPFPAPTLDGKILNGRWFGIWLDREFRQAIMAALQLDQDPGDGPSREELRSSIGGAGRVVPANSVWHRALDSEPMKIGSFGENLVFATLSGVYMIDRDANEIWRSPLPSWPSISFLGQYNNVVSINEFPLGLAIWSQAGGVSILDPNTGMEVFSRVVELDDKLSKVDYCEDAGWILMMHDGSVATMSEIEGVHSTFRTSGPVMDAKFVDGRWTWTGWRHDGCLLDGRVSTTARREIGVSILGDMVLENNGTWSPWGFPSPT